MEEGAAADRPFIGALAISSKACGTSHKPYSRPSITRISSSESPKW